MISVLRSLVVLALLSSLSACFDIAAAARHDRTRLSTSAPRPFDALDRSIHHDRYVASSTGIQSIDYPHPYTEVVNAGHRYDINGDMMDIHDGKIILVNGTYLYIGAAYGDCIEPQGESGCGVQCGYNLNHNISLYTSDDLMNWVPSPRQPIFQVANDWPVKRVILFCPKMLYNPRTNLWVMWINYATPGVQGGPYLGVLTSNSPHGPWTVVSTTVPSLTQKYDGDYNLFLDDNNDAYLLYSTVTVMTIEKLSFDYTFSLGIQYTGGDLHTGFHTEAPAMAKRHGKYLVSFGVDCCYCGGGSATILYTSDYPLGPYTKTNVFSSAVAAQQTDMLAFQDVNNQTHILWLGDRWQSAPDHQKGHDLTYMGVLNFDKKTELVQQIEFLDRFPIAVLKGNPGTMPLPGANSGAVASSSFAPPSKYMGSSIGLSSSGRPSLELCYVDLSGPRLPPASYEFTPRVNYSQPWVWTSKAGGIASTGSKFDPLPPVDVFGSQYLFLPTSSDRSVLYVAISGAVPTTQLYTVSFNFALTAEKASNSSTQLRLLVDGDVVWQSVADLPVVGGWTAVSTKPFSFNSPTAVLALSVEAKDGGDHNVLINSVSIVVAAPLVDMSMVPSYDYSFESPVLPPGSNEQRYMYNPPVNNFQIWSFTPGRGGIATVNSVWDVAPPFEAPSCRSYAYLQNRNNTLSTMSTWLSHMNLNRDYHLTFFYGVRSSILTQGGMSRTALTTSQMTIFIDGQPIWISRANLTDSGSWIPIKTMPFSVKQHNVSIEFVVVNYDVEADSSILVDQIHVHEL